MNNNIMYDSITPVNELNKVPGFEPRRFLRKTVSEDGKELLVLDLKYRKMWFRLKYRTGRIKVTALKITEQLAIFEAKVYFDGASSEPEATRVAERFAKGKYGALYIESAQNAAVGEALSDAGFGLQFCDVNQGADFEAFGGEVAIPPEPSAQAETPKTPPEQPKKETALVAESDVEPEEIPAPEPIAELVAQPDVPEPPWAAYTPDMPTEELCARMTVEDAAAIVVDSGMCKGMTLAEVAEKRPASLKWYLNGYTGGNNLLRAGAKLLLEYNALPKAG